MEHAQPARERSGRVPQDEERGRGHSFLVLDEEPRRTVQPPDESGPERSFQQEESGRERSFQLKEPGPECSFQEGRGPKRSFSEH
jgi:hypothetical protein